MKKYEHLFFDLDHTLWDFDTNARHALHEVYNTLRLKDAGVLDVELFYTLYLQHNEGLWEQYRNGKIKQDELRVKRMRLTLLDFKIINEALATEMNELFLDLLPIRNTLFPHTMELLTYLQNRKYHIHMITNGFNSVQQKKITNSGLAPFFKHVITSEMSMSLKPNREIFEYAFKQTGAEAYNSIMIGDTEEVDIAGAKQVGMDQIFVNHISDTYTSKATYTVTHLQEIENIL